MFFPQRWPGSLYWSNLVLCNARIQPYSAHCCLEQILHGAARSFQFFFVGFKSCFPPGSTFLPCLFHSFSFARKSLVRVAPLSPLRHHDWRPGGAQTLRPHQRHQCGQSRRSCRAGESCLRCAGWGPGPGSVMATLGHDFIGIQYWLVVWNMFYFSI